jgi:hypothetical protein
VRRSGGGTLATRYASRAFFKDRVPLNYEMWRGNSTEQEGAVVTYVIAEPGTDTHFIHVGEPPPSKDGSVIKVLIIADRSFVRLCYQRCSIRSKTSSSAGAPTAHT